MTASCLTEILSELRYKGSSGHAHVWIGLLTGLTAACAPARISSSSYQIYKANSAFYETIVGVTPFAVEGDVVYSYLKLPGNRYAIYKANSAFYETIVGVTPLAVENSQIFSLLETSS